MTQIYQLASELGAALSAKGWIATTAESCTGGGVAYAITEVAGSSAWFGRSFVAYSYEAKQHMLNVSEASLAEYGAVSEAVVFEMACGALAASRADLSVAISGIAGPDGATEDKPLGTVWFCWADVTGWQKTQCFVFEGDRSAVRKQAIATALSGMLDRLHEIK